MLMMPFFFDFYLDANVNHQTYLPNHITSSFQGKVFCMSDDELTEFEVPWTLDTIEWESSLSLVSWMGVVGVSMAFKNHQFYIDYPVLLEEPEKLTWVQMLLFNNFSASILTANFKSTFNLLFYNCCLTQLLRCVSQNFENVKKNYNRCQLWSQIITNNSNILKHSLLIPQK